MPAPGSTPIIIYNSSTASATPAAGNLSQGELAINVTDKKIYTKDSGGNVVTIVGTLGNQAANNVAITGGSITGITDLAVADGGTGASTFTANNVLLGNGSSSFQTVAPGASGNVLTSNGTTWTSAAPAASGVTSFSAGTTGFTPNTGTTGAVTLAGTLATTNGGTGLTGFTAANNAIYSTSSSALTAGTLPTAAGGTGLTTFTAANNAIYSSSSSALTAGTLPVAAGGTGATTHTANNVLIGNGTSAITSVAPGTSGNVLTSNGTAWTSAAPAASGGMTLLGTINTTSGNTQSLSGLTLTNYKALYFYANAISCTQGTTINIGVVRLGSTASGNETMYGNITYDLASGFGSGLSRTGNTTAAVSEINGYTTATTSVSVTTGGTFDAGSVKVYGVS